ncbi:MAG TPA: hypothetical protein VIE68_11745 [Gemmatimonadota bacterium]
MPVGTLRLAGAALTLIATVGCGDRAIEPSACPREFSQTRLAAILLWSGQGLAPSPAPAGTPEDLVLLEDPLDSATCARLASRIPDTLAVGAIGAPFITAFYRVGDAYVVPVVPRVTTEEIDAEARGETILWKEGVTLVFDRDFELLASAPN